ncbi:tetratricopeptide repeat protein [Sphingomonas oryzagri]
MRWRNEQFGQGQRALADYDAAIRLQADNADAHMNRGLILLDANKLDPALAAFNRVLAIRPGDTDALANRGITYAWKNDRGRAEQDFAAVQKTDPANPVALRGEALLAMDFGDIDPALDRLTAALKVDPKDRWSLGMRAKVYRQLGEPGKSEADIKALRRLNAGITAPDGAN